ncbi:hypothetical protein F2Q69_00014082 [Brassica cretica]|uniref:Uncharacterized protein n=1 Tax=Brassica cretica TaxID=69181 RepID=A0A8S9R0N4_BRACR|nr:hypothetical protein F2Q69_00014082 [Brassica cretica]
MAESHTRETNCVYVETSLDTHLLVLLHDRETISDFKVKLCKEHHQCFPQLGEIDISAVKVNRQNTLGLLLDYHLPDSMLLSMVFNGIGHFLDGYALEAGVAEKTTKTKELELSDGEKS